MKTHNIRFRKIIPWAYLITAVTLLCTGSYIVLNINLYAEPHNVIYTVAWIFNAGGLCFLSLAFSYAKKLAKKEFDRIANIGASKLVDSLYNDILSNTSVLEIEKAYQVLFVLEEDHANHCWIVDNDKYDYNKKGFLRTKLIFREVLSGKILAVPIREIPANIISTLTKSLPAQFWHSGLEALYINPDAFGFSFFIRDNQVYEYHDITDQTVCDKDGKYHVICDQGWTLTEKDGKIHRTVH